MEGLNVGESATGECSAQQLYCTFDFRKLRHNVKTRAASEVCPCVYAIVTYFFSTLFHMRGTIFQNPRSLKYEYEQYVESEIEIYKDSIARSAILKIGDEAVASLTAQDQIALTEMVIWQEVDRIIARRLRLPSYQTWRRRRLKQLEQYRRPEHWGLDPNAVLVRELQDAPDRHVLVAGVEREGPALFLAARGCSVTAVEPAQDSMQRVLAAAQRAGLVDRIRGLCADLAGWSPDVELHAVVCNSAIFAGLSESDRARVISVLQHATATGGVHLLETTLREGEVADVSTADSTGDHSASGAVVIPIEELESRYRGWRVTVERSLGDGRRMFLARKDAVA